MSVGLDPDRVRRFRDRLDRESRKRIPQDVLWNAFVESFPGHPQGREAREWLLAALRELEAQGRLQLPSPHGKLWDRQMEPAIPSSVLRVVDRPTPDDRWRAFPWHPALAWVPDLPRATAAQVEFLNRVHRGLVEGWFDAPAPLRHRSLQLARHEKDLGRLMRTSLFSEGRISLDLLGCVLEATPLAWEQVGPGEDMIIFENAGPFHVGREVLRAMDDPPYGMIGYGGGGGFRRTIRYLATLDAPPRSLRYVGDLDRPGIRIAARAAQVADEVGLPRLEPATEIHSLMFERAATFGREEGWPHKPGLRFEGGWAKWLDEAVRPEVVEMLSADRRIPEEVLGPDDLRYLWALRDGST